MKTILGTLILGATLLTPNARAEMVGTLHRLNAAGPSNHYDYLCQLAGSGNEVRLSLDTDKQWLQLSLNGEELRVQGFVTKTHMAAEKASFYYLSTGYLPDRYLQITVSVADSDKKTAVTLAGGAYEFRCE